MSVLLLVVVAVAVAVVVLPFFMAAGLYSHFKHGTVSEENDGSFETGSKDTARKTQEDLREKTREMVAEFLDRHDFKYESNAEFSTEVGDIEVAFYLPGENKAVIMDDWYKEYRAGRYLDFSTVIVELHVTREYQLDTLRRAFDVEDDWRELLELDEDAVSDLEVLGIEDENPTFEEVRNAYREMIKETHPDLNDSEDAEREFKKVKEAYENLKAGYDEEGVSDGAVGGVA
ncbi:MAG: DnaJ domain-containing protein [Halobacteria archaeon]